MIASYGIVLEGVGAENRVHGYEGEHWPSPEVIWLVDFGTLGMKVPIFPDHTHPESLAHIEKVPTITYTVLTLRSHSKIAPGTSEHVLPCARYAPVGMTDDGRQPLKEVNV